MNIAELLQQFIAQYTGVSNVGNTPENKGQCVGLIEVWIDILKLPHVWGNAIDLLTNADATSFQIILNRPDNFPLPGDVAVLGKPYGLLPTGIYAGHTGVVVTADINAMQLFEQNDPALTTPHLQSYDYSKCLGWLHPVESPIPTMYKGINMADTKSVEVAIDTWFDVASGKYILMSDCNLKSSDLQKTIDGLNQTIGTQNITIAQDQTKISSLENQLTTQQKATDAAQQQANQLPHLQIELNQAEADKSKAQALADSRLKIITSLTDQLNTAEQQGVKGSPSAMLLKELTQRIFHIKF